MIRYKCTVFEKSKDLKSKARGKRLDFFLRNRGLLSNRKQVPLCNVHHKALHNNILSTSERELFESNIKSFK